MLTPGDGYPVGRLPRQQKVTLLIDSVTHVMVSPQLPLHECPRTGCYNHAHKYIYSFSVVGSCGWCSRSCLSFNSRWYRPHGYHPREGVTPTMWVPAEVIHAGAISLNWRHSSWRLYLKLGCRPYLFWYQIGPNGTKLVQKVPFRSIVIHVLQRYLLGLFRPKQYLSVPSGPKQYLLVPWNQVPPPNPNNEKGRK